MPSQVQARLRPSTIHCPVMLSPWKLSAFQTCTPAVEASLRWLPCDLGAVLAGLPTTCFKPFAGLKVFLDWH